MRRAIAPIIPLAVNTFREAVRSKVLGALLLFVVLSISGSALLGEMSLHEEARVAADGSLFSSTMFCVAIAIYAMVTLLHKELEQRTIYTILAKPIARWQFLCGKYLGVAFLLATIVVALFALALVIVTMQGGDVSVELGLAFVTLYLQCLVLTAVTLVFASFSSPLLSGMFAICLFIAGNLMTQLETAKASLENNVPGSAPIVDILLVVLPNFESLNLSWFVTHGKTVSLSYMLAAGWYAASYSAIALLLAIVIFSRRDLA